MKWNPGDRILLRDRPWRIGKVTAAGESHHILEVEALDGDHPDKLSVVRGMLRNAAVTIVNVEWGGSDALPLLYRGSGGSGAEEFLYRDNKARLEIVEQSRPWSFDSDGAAVPPRTVQGIPVVAATDAEGEVLRKVSSYCARTARAAADADDGELVGFAMQILKKRALSSRAALAKTLEHRLEALRSEEAREEPPALASTPDVLGLLAEERRVAERFTHLDPEAAAGESRNTGLVRLFEGRRPYRFAWFRARSQTRVRGAAMKNEDIPALIRKLRQRPDLTREQFAQRSGVTSSTANHWENGKRVPLPSR